ncbi:hypothetical protein G6F24_016730 [Rhizopus arrhizus]|nr:hypothetical protein G6F24_016730 [Rhizopus arrhizus]
MAFARARQAAREFVDVAGGVRRRVEAAVAIRLQRGFDIAGFAAGYRDAPALQVEVDAFGFCHVEEMLACFDGQPRGGDGVFAVVRELRHELRQPRILVPAELGVQQ